MGKKIVIILGVLVVVMGGILLTIEQWLPALMLKPNHEFSEQQPPSPPDYSKTESWAAWPGRDDPADEMPAGVTPPPEALRNAAVFYVYPTINVDKSGWNQNLADPVQTNLADQLPIKGQATAFQGCCTVYIPYYRQATLWTYFDSGPSHTDAMSLAYADVARAFDHFLNVIGDQPIVLASHSQGTTHLERLLQDKVHGEVAERVVAIYAIGYGTPLDLLGPGRIQYAVCDSPDETACLIHWDTYIDGAPAPSGDQSGPGHWFDGRYGHLEPDSEVVCVNPISWRANEQPAPVAQHKGAIDFRIDEFAGVFRGAKPAPDARSSLAGIIPNVTYARCDKGRLMVDRNKQEMYGNSVGPGDSLHLADYSLFWKDIYDNAILRVNAFVEAR